MPTKITFINKNVAPVTLKVNGKVVQENINVLYSFVCNDSKIVVQATWGWQKLASASFDISSEADTTIVLGIENYKMYELIEFLSGVAFAAGFSLSLYIGYSFPQQIFIIGIFAMLILPKYFTKIYRLDISQKEN